MSFLGCRRPRTGQDIWRLLDELAERAAVLCRNRVKTTCVAVALVAGKWELAPADREPPARAWLDSDHEPDRARVTGCCACGPPVCELRFEPSEEELDLVAYSAFPRRRSARWRR